MRTPRSAPRARVIAAGMTGLLGAVALAACDGTATGLRDSRAGPYALQSVDGTALPATVYTTSGHRKVETDTLVLWPDGTAAERATFVYYFSVFDGATPDRTAAARRGTWTERGGVKVVWTSAGEQPHGWWSADNQLTATGNGLTLHDAGMDQPKTWVYGRVVSPGA